MELKKYLDLVRAIMLVYPMIYIYQIFWYQILMDTFEKATLIWRKSL